jgi:hypothetical protein
MDEEFDPRICQMRFTQIEAEVAKQNAGIREDLAAMIIEQKEINKAVVAIQQKIFNGINERVSMLSRMVWWLLGIAATATVGIVLSVISKFLTQVP